MRCRQLFGRDSELALLRREVALVRDGRGGVVLVRGPAGIGKSRLAAELLEDCELMGLHVAVGRATPNGSAAAYLPLTQALLHVVRRAGMPDDGEFAAWRTALAPVLGDTGSGAGMQQSVTVRAEAVVQLLRRTVRDGALIVIEDVHWADPDTLGMLDVLADSAVTLPVLWMVTARDCAAVEELADRLRGRRRLTVMTLEPLPPAAVAQMVADCRADADATLLAHVQRVAEGVPLYVEELAAAGGVPASFRRTVSHLLDRLDDATRPVVDAAAVIGDVRYSSLVDATGGDAAVVATALRRAIEVGLFVETVEGVVFRHALTREAVLEALGDRRREVAAAVLAAAGSVDAELAAHLAELAGDWRRAGVSLAAAGERAVQRGGLTTAVESFRRAVGMLQEYPEGASVRLRFAEVLSLTGDIDEALSEAETCHAAEPSPRGRLVLAEIAARGARWTLASRHLVQAQAGARRDLLAAEIAFAMGDSSDARSFASRVIDGVDPDLRCRALILLGRIDRLTDLGAARTGFERALSIARAARSPVRELDALHELGTIDMFDHAGTSRLLDARRAAERLGALGTRSVLDLQLTAAYLGRFEPAAAERHATCAADTADRLGLAAIAGKARCGLAEVCTQRLDANGMERFLAEALNADPDEPFTAAFGWGQCRGMLALFQASMDEALGCFDRAVALLAKIPHPEPVEFRALWPLLLAATGDPRASAALAAAAESDLTIAFANRGLLGYASAILAGAGGDRSAAADLALSADAYLVRFPVWGHLARWIAADAAARDGWGQPSAWLAAAEPGFAALGFEALAKRCRRSRAQEDVTAREQVVLGLVSQGLTNRAIADRLHLSSRTVEKHVENLLRKTGSRTRTELATLTSRRTT